MKQYLKLIFSLLVAGQLTQSASKTILNITILNDGVIDRKKIVPERLEKDEVTDFQQLLDAIEKEDLKTVKSLVEKRPYFLTSHSPTNFGTLPDIIYLYAWRLNHDIEGVKPQAPIFDYLTTVMHLLLTLSGAKVIINEVLREIDEIDLGTRGRVVLTIEAHGRDNYTARLEQYASNVGNEKPAPLKELNTISRINR